MTSNWTSLFVAGLLLFVTTQIAAEEHAVLGQGNVSCGSWLNDRMACWIALPKSAPSGILLLVAGLLQAFRHLRWAGDRTLADRWVKTLHRTGSHGFLVA
jgi:hypothetical protein